MSFFIYATVVMGGVIVLAIVGFYFMYKLDLKRMELEAKQKEQPPKK